MTKKSDKIANDFSKKLGADLRQRRKLLSLTQQELADLSGVGILFVSELERGKPTIRLDKLRLVLKVLGMELKLSIK